LKHISFKTSALTILLSISFSYSQSFDKEVFAQRREKLMEKISGGVVVMLANPVYERNNDVDYDYRQESNFYYLTGFEESSSAIILDPRDKDKYTLFVQQKNPALEIWTGIRTGTEGAVSVYGADKSLDIKKFDSILNNYTSKAVKIYCIKSDKELSAKIKDTAGTAELSDLIGEMRLIKSDYELEQLKRAIEITCLSINEVFKKAKPGMYEYQLQAVLEYNYKMRGSPRNGFPSILGSGPNSCILHYETNRRQTEDGDIVVMDVGAEHGYYTADVTRTFPVNGKFSPAQKRIYNIVLGAQNEGINFVKPGVKFYQVDSVARAYVKKELIALGLMKESENVSKFFMHSTSHWLGLDVHDAGRYSTGGTRGDRVLQPGMVLTVEPGIYIAEGTEGVDAEYYNIGVRIEDDILVMETGHENLSKLAPREVRDIEKLMRKE
jgi:Xaa-Pro aminopeptidase